MRTSLRILIVAGLATAVMSIGAASASAVVVSNSSGTCPDITLNTMPEPDQYEGGCSADATATNSILRFMGQQRDCTVNIDAVVSGDGDVGINGLVVSAGEPGQPADCTTIEQCTLDAPFLPWEGLVAGLDPDYTATFDICVDSPIGQAQGTVVGDAENASGLLGPRVVFDQDPIDDPDTTGTANDATLEGVYNLDDTTLEISD